MKKFISFILAFCLCFGLAFSSSATGISTEIIAQENHYEEIILKQAETTDEATDIFDSLEDRFSGEGNEELNKIVSLAEKAATYIYNYATQPEEPSIDLATVITVVRIAVTVIYTIIQNYS